jgi:hypothetical protein
MFILATPGRSHLWLETHSLALTVFLLFSCSPIVKPVDREVVTTHFAFLQEGITRRQDVIDHFGGPRRDYEQGRIITYLMREDLNGGFQVISFREEGPIYNLVLSFGADDILVQYSLVRVQ